MTLLRIGQILIFVKLFFRIIKKPYRELQDSNGRPDEVVANEVRYPIKSTSSYIVLTTGLGLSPGKK